MDMVAHKTRIIATVAGVVSMLALSTMAIAQTSRGASPAAPSKATLAIVGGYLIDGHGGPPVSDGVVLIDGNQIVAVGTKDSVKVPAGVKTIDASGYSVLPGLFNVHVHLDLLGHADYDEWHHEYVPGSPEYARLCEVAARQLIMGGVTTAVDLAGHPTVLKAVRDRINRGELPGPRMLLSMGWIWHAPPAVAEKNHRFNHTFNVNGADEARAAAIKTIEMGADILKLWNGSTAAEVKAVSEEAHKRGLKVTGHTGGDQDTLARIQNGQDGIEHSSYDVNNPEIIRAMLTHRTVVDPTPIQALAAVEAIEWPEWRNDPRARQLTPPDLWAEIRGSIDHMDRLPYFARSYRPSLVAQHGKSVKALYDAGVRLVLGTDSGTPGNYHVDSTWRQMNLYVQFGIPAMDVIQMATRQSAEWVGLGNKTGTIEPGRFADLIIVDGNPLTDMAVLKDPVYVIKDGVQFKGPAAAAASPKPTTQAKKLGVRH